MRIPIPIKKVKIIFYSYVIINIVLHVVVVEIATFDYVFQTWSRKIYRLQMLLLTYFAFSSVKCVY